MRAAVTRTLAGNMNVVLREPHGAPSIALGSASVQALTDQQASLENSIASASIVSAS